jgi:hypothetical protein
MFGVRSESIDPFGFISNHEAATYYGYTKLSQLNADAWTASVETVMRLGIGPNRPLYFKIRDFIATSRQGSESITWGSSVQQTLTVNYRRGWSGNTLFPNNEHVYESFGGRASEPIDYALFFTPSDDSSSTKSLTDGAESSTKTPSTAAERAASLRAIQRFTPGSKEQVEMFTNAISDFNATAAPGDRIPTSWAADPDIQFILKKESQGYVGVPNYTYGTRSTDPSQWASVHTELKQGNKTTKSSATGLGQLLLSNVERYYPSGRAGIGVPREEAIGMLRYVKDRYGTPASARRQYGKPKDNGGPAEGY